MLISKTVCACAFFNITSAFNHGSNKSQEAELIFGTSGSINSSPADAAVNEMLAAGRLLCVSSADSSSTNFGKSSCQLKQK